MADCANFLQRIKPLATQYEANREKLKNFDIGFNLFELISDHYYRETFHSDILSALLDPTAQHKEGTKYLELFLEFIRARGANINLSHYSNAKVEREKGGIDVLITVEDSKPKRAIIIENKINNAIDQREQLPRYLKSIRDKGYECDAIIYLRLSGDAWPRMADWNNDQKNEVIKRLKVVCAYDGSGDGTEKDLLKGWILKCEKASKEENTDARHVLRQYAAIIRKLGANIMNRPIMKQLYEIFVEREGENFQIALSLKKMMDNDILPYRLERIIDELGSDPDPSHRQQIYKNGIVFDGWPLGLEIAVWADLESYLFEVYVRNGPIGPVQTMLQDMDCIGQYTMWPGKAGHFKFNKEFKFPSEEKNLIEHIKDFKEKLDKGIKSVSRSP